MQFHKVEYFLSAPHTARFLAATGGDQQLAFQLYLDSLRLAQAFHPVLGLLEVSLRNALNEQLTIHFNDPDWIIHQKTRLHEPFKPCATATVEVGRQIVPICWIK